jgi:methyl-accepting chemotaxis protein
MPRRRWFGLLGRSLQARLVAGFMVVVALLIGLGAWNIFEQNRLADRSTAMNVRDVVPLGHLREAQAAHLNIALLSMVIENVKNSGLKQPLEETIAQAEAAVQRLHSSAPAELMPDVEKLIADREAFMAAHEARIAATEAGDRAGEQKYHAEAGQLALLVGKDFDDVAAKLTNDAAQQREEIVADTARSRILTIGGLSFDLVLAGLLCWWIARSVRRPVNALMGSIEHLAAGDLTHDIPVTSQDEIGRMAAALGHAVGEIRTIVTGVAESAAALAGSSDALSATNHQISGAVRSTSERADHASASAAQVAGNVDLLSAAAVELGASIREISRNTGQAAEVGEEAVAAAQTTNAIVAKLGDSSAEIGQVLKVITSIAEQTNLLALNATIEAARAGDFGKGFAVVAGEVKELAQETAKATNDITRRVEAIQADAAEAVIAIAQIGDVIHRMNGFQTAIASAVSQQSDTSEEMGHTATAAASGSAAIATAITDVAGATGQTMTGIGETERAAAELAQLSRQLQDLVTRFRY